jgi:hypothetical protein
MKNAVFSNVTPCGSCENQSFGGTYRLHHQGEKNRRARTNVIRSDLESFHPDDGGDTFLRNIGSHKSHTTPLSQKTAFLALLVALHLLGYVRGRARA